MGIPISAAFPPPHGPATWVLVLYWVAAVLFSAFYGRYAVSIFVDPQDSKDKKWPWWTHEGWLNFLGSLVGWALALPLVLRMWPCLSTECAFDGITWREGAVAIIAFIGVTGFIPGTVVPLALGVGRIAGKLTELLAKWVARP